MGARIVRLVACLLMCSALVACGADQFLGRDPPYPALDPDQIGTDTDPETGMIWVLLDDLPATAQATSHSLGPVERHLGLRILRCPRCGRSA